jgi:glycosyltransferase involved in cell wall biosynthesis
MSDTSPFGTRAQTSSPEGGKLPAVRIAVLIPCFNEALTVASVVTSFRVALPAATIYVYDNRSTDGTAACAREAGAVVRHESWPGKGNVVRRMFADVDADVYLMADGDGTYDASLAPVMIARLIADHADMVVGTRKHVFLDAHRKGHGFGNQLFNLIYRRLIGPDFTDIFSGYRVFSRRFVKSFPAISSGFEIETEMSVHASQMRMPIVEVETEYSERSQGSSSKLRTFRDAFRILSTMLHLFKEIRPFPFFGIFAVVFSLTAVILGLPLLSTYLETGLVPRFPTAILATGLMLLAGLSLGCGLILDGVARGRLEQKRILYLALGSTHSGGEPDGRWPEASALPVQRSPEK